MKFIAIKNDETTTNFLSSCNCWFLAGDGVLEAARVLLADGILAQLLLLACLQMLACLLVDH